MTTGRHLSHALAAFNDTKPIRLQIVPELRDQHIERPHPLRLSPRHSRFAEIMERHAAAVAAGEPCYLDPSAGLSVFTAAFLANRGYCCDSGCRHCPFVVG
jgi:Family of unknown function (DUF5522)